MEKMCWHHETIKEDVQTEINIEIHAGIICQFSIT